VDEKFIHLEWSGGIFVMSGCPRKDKAGISGKIIAETNGFKSAGFGERGHLLPLVGADLKSNPAAGSQMSRDRGEKALEGVEAPGACEEGQVRVVGDFPGKELPLPVGDVREVGHDQIEGSFNLREKIALQKDRSQIVPFRILTCQAECVGRNVGENGFPAVRSEGQGNGDANYAAACPHVEHAGRAEKFQFQDLFDQFFGFRSGDQCALIAEELPATELHCPQEVLEWFSQAPALEKIPQRLELGFRHGAVELSVEFDTTAFHLPGHQPLHVTSGPVDTAVPEVFCPALDAFQDGLHGMRIAPILLFGLQAGFSETLGHLCLLQFFGEFFDRAR